jgi:hypothetical protein
MSINYRIIMRLSYQHQVNFSGYLGHNPLTQYILLDVIISERIILAGEVTPRNLQPNLYILD